MAKAIGAHPERPPQPPSTGLQCPGVVHKRTTSIARDDEPTTATMAHRDDDSHARHTQGPSSALSTTPSTGPRPRHRARARTPTAQSTRTAHDDDGSAQWRDDADGCSGMAKGYGETGTKHGNA